jgi:hypothetical protein
MDFNRELSDYLKTDKDYFGFVHECISNLIECEFPRYSSYLEGYWTSIHRHYLKKLSNDRFDGMFNDEEIETIALGRANSLLRQAYVNIDDSSELKRLQTVEGYKQFEEEFYEKQKAWLMKKVKSLNPEAIEDAEDLWQDIYADALNKDMKDESTFFPQNKKANNELRRYCAHLMKIQ